MISYLKQIFDCMIGINRKLCYARLWGSIGFFIFFINSFLAIDEPWDALRFAEGFGIIISASCAGIWAKGKAND